MPFPFRKKCPSPPPPPSSPSPHHRSPSFWAFSRRQWLTFCTLSLANLCTSTTFSCIVPFFPTEAKLKGLSTAEVGLIIGVFQLTMFCASPVLGKLISRIGSDRMFVSGLALCSFGSMLYGLLKFLPSPNSFFSAAILMRCATALGNAAFRTSSLTLIARHFPDHISSVMGLSSITMSVGYMVGPTIGSGLYELGGFSLPFFLLGFFILCSAVVSALIALNTKDQTDRGNEKGKNGDRRMEKHVEEADKRKEEKVDEKGGGGGGGGEDGRRMVEDKRKKEKEDEKEGRGGGEDGRRMMEATSLLLRGDNEEPGKARQAVGLLTVLRIPELLLMLGTLFVLELSLFFYDASLADHLAPLMPHHPSLLTGLMLSLTALLAMLNSPLCGMLVDRRPRWLYPLITSGSLLGLLFPLLMGPSPLLRSALSLSVPLVSVAFALQGLAITAIHTPSFKFCIDGAKRQGLHGADIDTCGCISGLLNAAISLGAFIGVVLGGLSIQWIGFEWTGTYAGLLHIIPLIAQLFLCMR